MTDREIIGSINLDDCLLCIEVAELALLREQKVNVYKDMYNKLHIVLQAGVQHD